MLSKSTCNWARFSRILDGLGTGLFEWNDLLLVPFDLIDPLQQVGDQDGPLLQTELVEVSQRLLDSPDDGRMLLFADGLLLGGYDIRQAHDALQQRIVDLVVAAGVHAVSQAKIPQLLIVEVEELLVDTGIGPLCGGLDRDEEVGLASLEHLAGQGADLELEGTIDGRQFYRKVQLLGVERANLDRNLFIG